MPTQDKTHDQIIRAVIDDVNTMMTDSVTEGTTTELATRLALVREAQTILNDVAGMIVDDLAARMEDDELVVTGVGKMVRRPKSSSTWMDDTSKERQHEDAIGAIIRQTCVDPATGEIHPPLANVARNVWKLTTDAFSLGADPKVAFRKSLGLRPDEYRSKRVTGYTITIEEETL